MRTKIFPENFQRQKKNTLRLSIECQNQISRGEKAREYSSFQKDRDTIADRECWKRAFESPRKAH